MPANAMLDTTGLNKAIDSYHRRNENAMDRAERAEDRNYQRDQNAMAFNYKQQRDTIGDQRYADETAHDRRRQSVIDARAGQEHAWKTQDRERDLDRKRATTAAGIFQNYIDTDPDPASRAAKTAKFVNGRPDLTAFLQQNGVDTQDPESVRAFVYAQAQEFQDPLVRRKAEADIAKAERDAAGGHNKYGKTGAVFEAPGGNFYTMQFAEDGSRKIEPVQIPGQGEAATPVPLTPARGVKQVGDKLVSQATGGIVRDVSDDIAGAEAAKKRGQFQGDAPQRDAGAKRLDNILSGLALDYVELNDLGAVVSTERGAFENFGISARTSETGQAILGAAGEKEQSIRQRVNNMRPLLLQGIMQATGMSARALDSNKELEFYLQAVTDPKRDLQSNLAAIDALDKAFGMGGVLQRSISPELYATVSRESDRLLAQRPISLGEPAVAGDPLAEARDAIARGAPREKVIERLRQNGIDAGGL